MRQLPILLSAAAFVCGGAAIAQTAAPADEGARTVEFELREGGHVIATPSVSMQVGRPAAISVDGDYTLRLRMEHAEAAGAYVIRSSLYRSQGGWRLIASPAVTVAEGEQEQIRFAGSDGRNLSLAVLVR